MKRFRLRTLMLLIVIAALGIAVVVQQRRAARREAELQAQLELLNDKYDNMQLLLKNERMMNRMQLTNMIRLQAELERERLGSKTMGAKEGTEK
jgi:type II secretory pathway pseudopilin PulG